MTFNVTFLSGGASAVSSPSGSSLTKSPEEILKYIQNFVPTAQLICETQHELSFILPDKGLKKGMLRKLFENLEKDKVLLGSKSFGLNDTTLEEVGLQLVRDSQKKLALGMLL